MWTVPYLEGFYNYKLWVLWKTSIAVLSYRDLNKSDIRGQSPRQTDQLYIVCLLANLAYIITVIKSVCFLKIFFILWESSDLRTLSICLLSWISQGDVHSLGKE